MKIKTTELGEVTNGGAETICASEPYTVTVTIQGIADILFHRWNCEAIEEKSKASKGGCVKTEKYSKKGSKEIYLRCNSL